MTTAKQARINNLDAHHTASLNKLSPTVPQSVAAHAASLGITQTEAQRRLSLLVDEGLAVALKNSKGAPLGTYQAV